MFDRRGLSSTLRKDGDTCAELNFARVKQAFETSGLSDYVQIVKSTTVEAAKKFSDLRCDFLFIDADHGYCGVRADFDAWSCKLNQDAILSFHDSNLPGVSRLLSEITDWEEFDRVDTLSVWRRA
jgi:predicted O-methyltransferase YrrM